MTVQLIDVPSLFAGAPYAYAGVVGASALIFTAGACPLDSQGQVVADGDVAGQARQALVNLEVALAECGAGLRDVVKTTVYVASERRADLVAAWAEVQSAFGEHRAPSTLLGVAVLGYQGQLVEIEAVAAVPRNPAPS